jgi:hypothetical protein
MNGVTREPLGGWATGLLVDPVKRRRRTQIDGHRDLLVAVDFADAWILGVRHALATGNLYTLSRCHERPPLPRWGF